LVIGEFPARSHCGYAAASARFEAGRAHGFKSPQTRVQSMSRRTSHSVGITTPYTPTCKCRRSASHFHRCNRVRYRPLRRSREAQLSRRGQTLNEKRRHQPAFLVREIAATVAGGGEQPRSPAMRCRRGQPFQVPERSVSACILHLHRTRIRRKRAAA